jgi:hypothetical protein
MARDRSTNHGYANNLTGQRDAERELMAGYPSVMPMVLLDERLGFRERDRHEFETLAHTSTPIRCAAAASAQAAGVYSGRSAGPAPALAPDTSVAVISVPSLC